MKAKGEVTVVHGSGSGLEQATGLALVGCRAPGDNEGLTDWRQWHEDYERAGSSLSRRLALVRYRIAEVFDRCPLGPIRVVSLCAGDGRDLLGVLQNHPRAGDVRGRLVELDPVLAEQARVAAPASIEISCRDAGQSEAYEGAVPADLVLCCGVLGNISDDDALATINSWPMLCAPEAIVIWTRGASGAGADRREEIRRWVRLAGFQELAFDGAPETYGVGVAKMLRHNEPYRPGVHFFRFHSRA